MKTVLKFNIKVSNEAVIKKDQFYYKIWILRRGTKNKTHIKVCYPLFLLDRKESLSSHRLILSWVLKKIRLEADVPDDLKQYCELWGLKPDDSSSIDKYLKALKEAKRIKKFLSQEEIILFPYYIDEEDEETYAERWYKKLEFIEEYNIKSPDYITVFNNVFLNDIKEYDRLSELQGTLDYYRKIAKYYCFDINTNKFNVTGFPTEKENGRILNMSYDLKNYSQALTEYTNYLKELIKKYKIRTSGNKLRRVAFHLNNNENNKMSRYKPIITDINCKI